MTMTGPQRLTPEAFAVEQLRADPNLDYATIRERAKEADLVVQPIHFGRARKQLGLPALAAPRPAPVPPPPARLEPPAIARPSAPAAKPAWVPDPRLGVSLDPLAQAPATPEPAPAVDEVEAGNDADTGDGHADTDAGTGLVAPRRKGSPAFDYLLQLLRNEPHAIYADLRARCAEKGFSIAPIMYGRAKAVLGLVPVKPRGKKTAAAAKPPAGPLQLMQVESVAADRFAKQLDTMQNLEQLMGVIRELDAERKRLRAVLERVIDLLDEALG